MQAFQEIRSSYGSFTMRSMDEKMVSLLERLIELQEESNEQQREVTQLLGELLNATDTVANRQPMIVNNALPVENTSVKNILNEGAQKGPVPPPDDMLLEKAIYGTNDPSEQPVGTYYDVDHFWPKGKANPGWVRVSIKHPSEASLVARLEKGCLCGKPIVLKTHNGESFHSCEALTQKGSCPYRPAAYFDKLTFLCNLPPKKS